MFAYDYGISGTWSDPKIEKLQPPTPINAPADPGSLSRDVYDRKPN
jgi:hypothetical protein